MADDDELGRIAHKGLKQLKRWVGEYKEVSSVSRQQSELVFRALMDYDAVIQDPELGSLLGLLYMQYYPALLNDFPDARELLLLATRILEGGDDGRSAARSFLRNGKYRGAVFDGLRSSTERTLSDLSKKPLSKGARTVYTALTSLSEYKPIKFPHSTTFTGELSDEELDLVLQGITSEAFVKELLVPRLLPGHFTHREKVQDGVEIARLMLLELDANIFYGCTFSFADLKALCAMNLSIAAKKKFDESSPLLWYMLVHPSPMDKNLRCNYLSMIISGIRPEDINVVNPRDFPDRVPEELQEDLSELDLRIARIIPDVSTLAKGYMVYERMSKELKLFLANEPAGRERVCLVHRLIPEVAPSASQVFEAMVLSFVVGADNVEEFSRMKQVVPFRFHSR